jgi:signal transduction histidine kinase
MKSLDAIKKRLSLTISLVLFVFAVMIAALALTGLTVVILYKTGHLSFSIPENINRPRGTPYDSLFALLGLCIFLGTALTIFFSKKALDPIRKVIDATHKVAGGDFNVQVDIKGIGELEELSQSFNKMTQELASIETLRNDFVNNFSHEFKTPIVSIRGFAKLLKEGNLTEEEKQEYLGIIIAESERLAALSTNVLNLAKYENMEILTEKGSFRLDEQIRMAVVMTEPKWSAKGIAMNVELEEAVFMGNEDLTQQIWLNLLDNAIKFSEEAGLIRISLSQANGGICFTIEDNGAGMNETTKTHIFDKFYQGDTSRSIAGYGLGLAIVKQIVDLCGGTIEVRSEPGKGSTFTVFLPN